LSHSQGRSFYVTSSGNDAHNGSLANPWKTVAAANSFDFEPGDVLFFAGGQTFGQLQLRKEDQGLAIKSYNGVATLGALYAYNVGDITIDNLNFVGAGTVNKLDGIKFYMDSTAFGDLNNIIIKNTSVSNFGGNGILIGAWATNNGFNNVQILNCKLFGNYVDGFASYGNRDQYSHTQLYIADSKAYNNFGRTDITSTMTGSGFVVGGFDGGTIEYCEAYGNGKNNRSTAGGPQGFWCYNSKSIVFQYSVSHHNQAGKYFDGGGFDIDGGSQNCMIQYCYSYSNEGAGYAFFEHGSTTQFSNNTIRYNISENDGRKNAHGGITMWAKDTLNRVKNSSVYNNTIYVTPSSIASAGYPVGIFLKWSNFQNITFYNNIIYTVDTLKILSGATTNATFSNNNYFTTGRAANFTKGGIVKDPLFKNPGGGKEGYVLRGPSPAINAGKTSPATQDFIGTTVPFNGGYDIGAYESTFRPPVANAGADQTVTLPNDATLTGSGTDPDGTIAAFSWTKLSGPASGLIENPNAASTTVSNLAEGTYMFRLTVTDNDEMAAIDDIKVVVKPVPPPTGTKFVQVNLFGGTNPYNDPEWNNWNVSASKTVSAMMYSDGTTSTVGAVISSTALSDNGSTYGGTMCPPEVLRYTSYGTGTRTLTLNGLSTTKTYNLELYASRANTGNSTIFTIGSTSVTIVTDHNKTNKASFTALRTNTAGQIIVSINKSATYNYLNGFVLTENSGTVAPPVPPTASAGPDQTIALPTNSVTLTGSGTDTDGSITKYSWTRVSGPSLPTIQTPGNSQTTVSNLVEGTYTFRLTVTDNQGLTASDDVQVIVNPVPPPDGIKLVKVNVFGGTNPYSNTEWNNWNTTASRTATALKYSDGTTSAVGAVISASTIADNGSTYGGTMCPPEVLRYTSYGGARSLTLSGLSTAKTYNLELYASRNGTGNSTIFTIGSTSITIVTDQNKTNKASFTALVPNSSGQIVVTIGKTATYSYLNGFVLTEVNNTTTKTMRNTAAGEETTKTATVQAFPNPAGTYFTLQVRSISQKPVQVTVRNGLGQLIEVKQFAPNVANRFGHAYKPGVYYAEVLIGNRKQTLKLLKSSQ
jgi:hypothetical protein